jgi:hypothetical protein
MYVLISSPGANFSRFPLAKTEVIGYTWRSEGIQRRTLLIHLLHLSKNRTHLSLHLPARDLSNQRLVFLQDDVSYRVFFLSTGGASLCQPLLQLTTR